MPSYLHCRNLLRGLSSAQSSLCSAPCPARVPATANNSGTWSAFADHAAEDLTGTVKPVMPTRLVKVLKALKWQEWAKDVSDDQLKQAGDKGGGKNDSF